MRPGSAWVATCAALGAASLFVTLGASRWTVELLSWHASLWPRMPWSLWTAPLVHRALGHGLANLLALAALAVLGLALATRPRAAWSLLLAWPLSTWALQFWPQITGFHGLSGVVHAAAAALAVDALLDRATRRMGIVLLAGLLIKLTLERAWAVPVAYDAAWGFNVVTAAHLTGALAGAVLVALASIALRFTQHG